MRTPNFNNTIITWNKDCTGNIKEYQIIEKNKLTNVETIIKTISNDSFYNEKNIVIKARTDDMQCKLPNNIIKDKEISIYDYNGNIINAYYDKQYNILLFNEEDIGKDIMINIYIKSLYCNITIKENCEYYVNPIPFEDCKLYGHSLARCY